MTQQTLIAIGTMLNAFPAPQGDVDVLVRSFEAATAQIAPQAVCEAATRYMSGQVDGHNPRYAPSVAEFAVEARRIADLKRAIARPRLPRPEYHSTGPAPFQIKQEQLRQKYAGWTILQEGVSLDQFQAMCVRKQVPPDATWIAALNGSVMIPPRKSETA